MTMSLEHVPQGVWDAYREIANAWAVRTGFRACLTVFAPIAWRTRRFEIINIGEA